MKIRTVTEDFIKDLLMKGQREDGRQPMSYRNIELKTGVIPNAEGSAQVIMGNTKMLAGVKVGVGEPMPDKPGEGNLITSAELHPMASDQFESGPPSPEAIELGRVIDRGIRAADMINSKSLGIDEEKVWEVFIDIYTLNYDGNLFDAGTLAAAAALYSARMPKYDAENEEVIREGNLGRFKIGGMVTSSTFGKIAGKVILDPDGNEEAFMDARITIANDENYLRAMQKGLGGSFSQKELETLIDASFQKSKDLRKLIISKVE
ncbi:MAG: exosome complex protein Rrp42 [Candidatus Micrarchaeota archaeon]|nr:exosome complex protein Rrp42 [Candidatus Micrarchaeota archaeon]MDE1859056.1 exosome complex protein Rrp42 [Candidatus Micrarchaeota archaeon]